MKTRTDIAVPTSRTSYRSLIDQLLAKRDPFGALGAYGFAEQADRAALEAVILATQRLRLTVAAAPYAPAQLLDRIGDKANDALRLRLAKNPATPAQSLARLLREKVSDRVQRYIAAHPKAGSATLYRLADVPSIEVRRAVAGNRNVPGGLLARLVAEEDSLLDKNAARALHADADLLRLLWDRGERYVRAELVVHPNCDGALLDAAERSSDPLIRRRLALNPALTSPALMRLLADGDERVRAAAVRNPAVSGEYLDGPGGDPSPKVRRIFARREGLAATAASRLATDPDSWVRRWIARNPAVSGEFLTRLAADDVIEVRRSAARNPACPASLLTVLAGDRVAWVRAGVALREDAPDAAISLLLDDRDPDVLGALGRNRKTPAATLATIACHPNRDVRRALAFNPAAPAPLLALLAQDAYPLNRVVAAGHPNLNPSRLQPMLDDPEPQAPLHRGGPTGPAAGAAPTGRQPFRHQALDEEWSNCHEDPGFGQTGFGSR